MSALFCGFVSWRLYAKGQAQFQFRLGDASGLCPSGNFSAKPGQLHIPEEP